MEIIMYEKVAGSLDVTASGLQVCWLPQIAVFAHFISGKFSTWHRHDWWIGWWVSSPFNHQFFVSSNINRISCWSCYDTFTLEALGIFPFVIRLSHFHCFLLEGIDDSFSSSLTVTIFLHFFALGRCLLLDTHHNSLLITAALTWSQWLKRVGWP